MPHYELVVLTQPKPGQEAAYNDWYQNTHLDQVVAIPGFVSARRYRLAQHVSGNSMPYLAVYGIETDDLPAAIEQLKARANTDAVIVTDALSPDLFCAAFEACGDPVTAG